MTDFFKFRNSLEEAKCGSKNTKREEEEKLDPVGKADADIDNDGDVDSSDEYLKKRRKAISKSMKNEDDGPCWKGYKQVGMKMKNGKEVPNCVPEEVAKEQVSESYYDYPDYGPVGASEMAQTQLHFIKYAADDITRCLKMGCPMPEWYQNKLAKIEGDMEGLYSYMKGKTRKMKAHQSDRYSMGMSMYGEETLNEARSDRSDDSFLNMFYFVAKKERGKTVYLRYTGSIEIGKMGEDWVENPDFATAYDSKRNAQKHAKRFGGKVQKGVTEQAKSSGDDDAYDRFFQAALKKFNVKGIGELDKEKKKEFFNYVDKNWKGDDETKNESVQIDEVLKPSDDVSTWIEDFYKSDAPQFKGKDKEERREMAVAAWLEARREAGYDVGPNPNE